MNGSNDAVGVRTTLPTITAQPWTPTRTALRCNISSTWTTLTKVQATSFHIISAQQLHPAKAVAAGSILCQAALSLSMPSVYVAHLLSHALDVLGSRSDQFLSGCPRHHCLRHIITSWASSRLHRALEAVPCNLAATSCDCSHCCRKIDVLSYCAGALCRGSVGALCRSV